MASATHVRGVLEDGREGGREARPTLPRVGDHPAGADFQPRDPQSREQQLKKMMPLFCKIFSGHMKELQHRFPEMTAFAGHVSKLLVKEKQLRASNKSAKEACITLSDFLENHGNEAHRPSEGWNMLNTINLLSCLQQAGGVEHYQCVWTAVDDGQVFVLVL